MNINISLLRKLLTNFFTCSSFIFRFAAYLEPPNQEPFPHANVVFNQIG